MKKKQLAQVNCQLYSISYNLDKDVEADKKGKGKLNRYTGGEAAGFLHYFCKDRNGKNIRIGRNCDDISVEDVISTPAYQRLQKECSDRGFFIDIGEQLLGTQNSDEKRAIFFVAKGSWVGSKEEKRPTPRLIEPCMQASSQIPSPSFGRG